MMIGPYSALHLTSIGWLGSSGVRHSSSHSAIWRSQPTARILVERDVETLDQVGPASLDEPRHVLAEVLARLGHEIAEPTQHLVAHAIPFRRAPFGREPLQAGVEIFAPMLEPQEERGWLMRATR
jgi:hypothetical protein